MHKLFFEGSLKTSLSDTRAAKSSLIFYCSIVITILISNVNPDNVVIPGYISGDVVWKDLALVQNITILNTVGCVASGCLLVSWILDILCQIASDNGGVYHAA